MRKDRGHSTEADRAHDHEVAVVFDEPQGAQLGPQVAVVDGVGGVVPALVAG
jgi:hypothetical protein